MGQTDEEEIGLDLDGHLLVSYFSCSFCLAHIILTSCLQIAKQDTSFLL